MIKKIPNPIVLALLLLITCNSSAQQPEKTVADYVAAGLAAQRSGNFEEALLQYAAAIKLDPKDFGAQFNSGASSMALKKPEQALPFFKVAVELEPNDPMTHYALGSAYSVTGHTAEALDALNEALRLDPKFLEAHRLLASIYDQQARHDDAIRALSAALKLRENDAAILYEIGKQHAQAGSLETALGYFNRSLAVKQSVVAYLGLGLAYARLKNSQSSIHAYSEALKLDPTNLLAQYNLGMALRQAGKHADAAAAFKRVTELKPDSAEAFLYLGLSYEDLGDSSKFLTNVQEAHRLNSNSIRYSEISASLYATISNTKKQSSH